MRKGNIAGVEFDEAGHRYFYEGHELSGITRAIGRLTGSRYPKTLEVEVATSYGSQVHKESERWIKEGVECVTTGGIWVESTLKQFLEKAGGGKYDAEVRVSDFENTASNVDVVCHVSEGVFLFDIKSGKFKRDYCNWQLNAYRLMYENCYPEKVLGMFVLNTKTERMFTIYCCDDAGILKLLAGNHK